MGFRLIREVLSIATPFPFLVPRLHFASLADFLLIQYPLTAGACLQATCSCISCLSLGCFVFVCATVTGVLLEQFRNGNSRNRQYSYSFGTCSVLRMNRILFRSFCYREQNERNSILFILKTEYYSQKNAPLVSGAVFAIVISLYTITEYNAHALISQ